MKYLASFFFVLCFDALAVEITVVGPCSPTPAHQAEFVLPATPMNVGAASIAFFEARQIPFTGSVEGIASILGTPTGRDAIEILREREMRAYGWCYQVDGVEPSLMPNEFFLRGAEKLLWFYAFSHYRNGEWISYCTPAHTIRPASLCSN